MSECEGCAAAAVNPFTGLFIAGCAPCQARQVSHAPDFARRRFYDQISDAEERAAFIEAVRLAYERRAAWAAK